MKNVWFQDVSPGFTRVACLSTRSFYCCAEGRGSLRQVEPKRRCLRARSADMGLVVCRRKTLGRPPVVPQQAAQTLLADNLAYGSIRFGRDQLRLVQRPVAQSLMGTKLVVELRNTKPL